MEDLGVISPQFWKGKRVLLTGHTGFKGGWLSLWLTSMGAHVIGLALDPDTTPNLFTQLNLSDLVDHNIIDIRNKADLAKIVENTTPDIVFHLAAQPLVLRSYVDPVETWQTNVGGTLFLLEALRAVGRPVTVVISTTDKVYENRERAVAYHEDDRLGGHDPYSASKAATELLAASWRSSFCTDHVVRIATARAGNVIGGGDAADHRIVPDIIRALQLNHPIEVRSPDAVRPWQHVLEPLSGYLRLAQLLHGDPKFARAYNFGPAEDDFRTVRDLVESALRVWPGDWRDVSQRVKPHEAGLLSVSSDLARQDLGWQPRWSFEQAVRQTLIWYRAVARGDDAREMTRQQIASYQSA